MSERDPVKKINDENKDFRLKVKKLEGETTKIAGTALFLHFSAEVEMRGVYLERAILSCDMAMGIACLQVSGGDTLNDSTAKDNGKDLFRKAAHLQKQLMPFAEIHSAFISATPYGDKVADYLTDMDQATELIAEADSLNDYCIEWRHNFAEKQNGLLETQ